VLRLSHKSCDCNMCLFFFFFNDTATTEFYTTRHTLSLHDALPISLSVSYIGRMARSLLARRDAMAFNDVRDPKSGTDWYASATILEKQRQQGLDTSQIAPIPFFNNLFPSNLSSIMDADPTVRSFCT